MANNKTSRDFPWLSAIEAMTVLFNSNPTEGMRSLDTLTERIFSKRKLRPQDELISRGITSPSSHIRSAVVEGSAAAFDYNEQAKSVDRDKLEKYKDRASGLADAVELFLNSPPPPGYGERRFQPSTVANHYNMGGGARQLTMPAMQINEVKHILRSLMSDDGSNMLRSIACEADATLKSFSEGGNAQSGLDVRIFATPIAIAWYDLTGKPPTGSTPHFINILKRSLRAIAPTIDELDQPDWQNTIIKITDEPKKWNTVNYGARDNYVPPQQWTEHELQLRWGAAPEQRRRDSKAYVEARDPAEKQDAATRLMFKHRIDVRTPEGEEEALRESEGAADPRRLN